MSQTDAHTRDKKGPGGLSRWIQRRANARTAARIRRKGGAMMGMDVAILHTVGRRTDAPRETPVAWFADPDTPNAWLVVASGGGAVDPDWYQNLMAHPDRAALEMHGQEAAPVAPAELTGPDRDDAWQRIVTAMPRLAKYQSKSDRQYPVIRLSAR